MDSSGQLDAPVVLPPPPGDRTRYLLDRRLGELQGWYGHNGDSSITIINLVLFHFCEKHVTWLQILSILNLSNSLYAQSFAMSLCLHY
jgi:hypothetical protein